MDGEARQERVPGIGPLLRAYRLQLGGSIDDAAAALHIRPSFLHAIEEGRYSDLPGPAYASGFVRAYAEYMGLDSEQVVRRFRAETAGTAEAAELHFPMPEAETAAPRGGVLLVGLLIALVAYGAWYVGTSQDNMLAELVAPLPDRLAALLPGSTDESSDPSLPAPSSKPAAGTPSEPAADESGPPSSDRVSNRVETTELAANSRAEPRPTATRPSAAADGAAPAAPGPAADTPAAAANTTEQQSADTPPRKQATAAAATPEQAVTATGPAGQAPETVPTPADAMAAEPYDQVAALDQSGGRNGGGAGMADPEDGTLGDRPRVVLEASERSWVEIRDSVGNRIMSRLMAPGEVFEVPDETGLRLTVGNAGGLGIRVDGDPVPPLGGPGVVRRNVPLEPERLQRGDSATY